MRASSSMDGGGGGTVLDDDDEDEEDDEEEEEEEEEEDDEDDENVTFDGSCASGASVSIFSSLLPLLPLLPLPLLLYKCWFLSVASCFRIRAICLVSQVSARSNFFTRTSAMSDSKRTMRRD